MKQIDNNMHISEDNSTENEKRGIEIIPKPMICCIDVQEEVLNSLKNNGYNFYKGTLGAQMQIPINRGSFWYLELDYDFPKNFHEYDILILDLTNEIKKEFKSQSVENMKIRSKDYATPICSFPKTIFDPRPASSYILNSEIKDIANHCCPVKPGLSNFCV